MNKFNLIMLSAFHEQGGNTLLRFLDGHPSFNVYPFESQLATPHSSNLLTPAVPQRYCWPEFTTEMMPIDAYHAMWDQELKTYLRTPHVSKFKDCGIVMDEKKRIDAFIEWVERYDGRGLKSRGRPEYVEAFFRSTFEAWENQNRSGQETHYVGYSPPILIDTDKIMGDFPDAHIVHIIRNPWSGYADTIKRPFPFSLMRYCQIWNVVQMHARVYRRKYPNNFHILFYEDLIDDPLGELNNLAEKLGIPKSDTFAYPSFNGNRLELVYPWGTIKTPTTQANLATALELTPEQIRSISIECYDISKPWYGNGDYAQFVHDCF